MSLNTFYLQLDNNIIICIFISSSRRFGRFVISNSIIHESVDGVPPQEHPSTDIKLKAPSFDLCEIRVWTEESHSMGSTARVMGTKQTCKFLFAIKDTDKKEIHHVKIWYLHGDCSPRDETRSIKLSNHRLVPFYKLASIRLVIGWENEDDSQYNI